MYTHGALFVCVKLEAGFMSLWYCGHLWSRYLEGGPFTFISSIILVGLLLKAGEQLEVTEFFRW